MFQEPSPKAVELIEKSFLSDELKKRVLYYPQKWGLSEVEIFQTLEYLRDAFF